MLNQFLFHTISLIFSSIAENKSISVTKCQLIIILHSFHSFINLHMQYYYTLKLFKVKQSIYFIQTFRFCFIINLKQQSCYYNISLQVQMDSKLTLLDDQYDFQPCLNQLPGNQLRKKLALAKLISPKAKSNASITMELKKNSPVPQQKQNNQNAESTLEKNCCQPQICLLHSSPIELLCMQDKCLICCKCALFGQHKGHQVQNRQGLVNKITFKVQRCLQIYEQLKEKQNQIFGQKSQIYWQEKVLTKKNALIKEITSSFEEIYQQLKRSERLCINKVQSNYKNHLKIISDGFNCQLNRNIQAWYKQIEQVGEILDQITNLKKASDSIQYLERGDKDLSNLGLNYIDQLIQKKGDFFGQLQKQINLVKIDIDQSLKNKIGKYCAFKQNCQIANLSLVNSHKINKSIQQKSDTQTKEKSSQKTKELRQDDFMLLSLEVDSFRSSFQSKQIYPQGLPSLSISHIHAVNDSHFYQANKSQQDRSIWFKQNNVSQPYKKKKKNLEVPEKFKGTIDDLKNDRADVIDLTGAQLGDSNILALCEYIKKSKKVRILKLIRNKITDDSFMDLLIACKDTKISSLNISQNSLTDKAVNMLEQTQLKKLKNITLSLNKINRRNVKNEIQALSKKGITLSI